MSDDTPNSSNFCSFVKNFFNKKSPETVRETIEDLIEEANTNGEDQFSEHEQLLLNNILCLRDKKCGSAMIPRADIISFPKDGSITELADLMVTKGHSRIPIYGESLDDIVGIVHVIDLVKCLLKGQTDTKVAEVITGTPKFVSPSMRVLDLLRDMQLTKTHMAMVVDEYGGIDGLVTIEDLLEEIVGDIEDEYDFDEDPLIAVQDNGIIIADAKAELSEIEDIAHTDLSSHLEDEELDIDTLGGLVFHIAQRIPSRGEIIDGVNGIKFRILDVDPRRIKKIMIVLPTPSEESEAANVE